jgi:putative MATE family efflux protein
MRAGAGGPKLTTGPIGGHLVSLTMPMLFGMIAMISYGIADTYFVAQLGTLPLAAMSFTFPVNFVASGIALAIGTGSASVLARLMGTGDRSAVQRITTHAVLLGALLGGLFMVLGLSTIDPLFRLLGADDRTLPLIHEYMQIYYIGGAFIVLPMIGNSALRATGDAKLPGLIMTISALFNIILDPLLIFGLWGFPRLELQGAAIATVLANAGTFVAAFMILYFREHLVRFRHVRLQGLWDSWRRVLHVGVPAMATNMVTPITAGIITAMIARFGPESVAGFGVATRVEMLGLIVIFSLGAAMAPFVGQNFGAGDLARVRRSVNLASLFCLGYGLVLTLVMGLFGARIATLFDDNAAVVEVAAAYFLIVPITYAGLGMFQVASTCFNALGKPIPATALTFARMFVIYLPIAFLLVGPFEVNGVFMANAVANVVIGVGAYLWLRRTLRLESVAG